MKRLKLTDYERDLKLQYTNFYYISKTKNILKDKNEFRLENVFEPDGEDYVVKDGEVDVIELANVAYSRCNNCSHAYRLHDSFHCNILQKVLGCEWYSVDTRCDRVYKCDAYDKVSRINYIANEQEMVAFIARTENFFECPEDYEAYFGFERRYDDETGTILETTQEYYERGGKFENIPTDYPSIVVFDYNVEEDLLYESMNNLSRRDS